MFLPLKFGLFDIAFIEFGPDSHSGIKVRKLVDFENTFDYKLGMVWYMLIFPALKRLK